MRQSWAASHVRSIYNFKVKFRVRTDSNFPESRCGGWSALVVRGGHKIMKTWTMRVVFFFFLNEKLELGYLLRE